MKSFFSALNHNTLFIRVNTVVLFLLLNGAASSWNCRWDMSRDRVNSVTESTEKVFARQRDPVLVEAYITSDLPGELKAMLSPILYQLDEIGRVGGKKVRLRIINPDTEEKKQAAEQRGIQGNPFEQARVDEVSQRLGYFGIYIQSGEKSTVLPLVEEGRIIEDFEYRFLREVKALNKKDGPSGIGYVRVRGTLDTRSFQQSQEPDKDNLFGFYTLMQRAFGNIVDVDLSREVDRDVETLILTGLPHFDDRQAYHLDQFLMRGGNLVCMLKGFDFQLQQMDPRMARMGIGGQGRAFAMVQQDELSHFNQLFSKYGISLRGEVLFEPELAAPEMDIQGQYVQKVRNPSWAVYSRDTGTIVSDLPAVRGVQQVVFPWVSGFDLKEDKQPNVTFSPLVVTTPDAISKDTAPLGLREMQKIGRDPSDVRVDHSLPVAVLASGRFQSAFSEKDVPPGEDKASYRGAQAGSRRSSIIVLGSAYMVSDILLRNESNFQIFRINQAFVTNLVEAAQGDNDLAAARARVGGIDYLRPLFSRDDTLQAGFEKLFMWFHILFLPVLLGIYGARRLALRGRRRGLEEVAK
ncbi:MAG TPA: GldG family protein [Leptospiraceae bacterium]|nr:GldG family protein [Leptospiraceae bacterium]